MLQPHSPNSVAQLCKEIVPEGRADERGAQRVVLGYVLEDQSEGTPSVENAEGGGAQRIHRRRRSGAEGAPLLLVRAESPAPPPATLGRL